VGDPQESRRQELWSLLGELPSREVPPEATLVEVEDGPGYAVEHLVLHVGTEEPVPAVFVRPAGAPAPWPVVLFNHSHGGNYELGKRELLEGSRALQRPPYAEALAARGIASLAIDHRNFGERRGRTESELFKELLWKGQVLWGLMVFDSVRAVDYLVRRPDVDPARLGTLGLSMGSTMAWWLAALDPRIRVCVDLCCLTDFASLLARRGLDGHGLYYYVPGLLRRFSTAEINALIAPRAHLALAGLFDPLTPPEGLEAIDRHLREVYAAQGAPEAWRLLRYPCGHLETRAMRAEVLAFLDRWL
jgi:cephalosporin-C deacetylase-like acetyl esterase